jgi:Flp pilus assembly protein CpaB
MNKKVSLLILSIVLAVVVFCISTYIQKKAVNFVPTLKCLVASKNIEEYTPVHEQDFEVVDMPISIVANTRVVQSYDQIEDLYLKDKVYKGQILLIDQFDTKSNLMIFNGEEGKEKISIKVKSPENAASYIVKTGSLINVYATLNSDYAFDGVLKDTPRAVIGEGTSGYSIVKVLSNVKVLSTFDENGEEVQNTSEKQIDTILVLATPEEAQVINLIREVASFNITEI